MSTSITDLDRLVSAAAEAAPVWRASSADDRARWLRAAADALDAHADELVAIADEFGQQLFDELDYEAEAANCRRFGQLYGGVPGILVPRVDELAPRAKAHRQLAVDHMR